MDYRPIGDIIVMNFVDTYISENLPNPNIRFGNSHILDMEAIVELSKNENKIKIEGQ